MDTAQEALKSLTENIVHKPEGRPPKKEWDACVARVKRKGIADDPDAFCGWAFHNGDPDVWAGLSKSDGDIADRKLKEILTDVIDNNDTDDLIERKGLNINKLHSFVQGGKNMAKKRKRVKKQLEEEEEEEEEELPEEEILEQNEEEEETEEEEEKQDEDEEEDEEEEIIEGTKRKKKKKQQLGGGTGKRFSEEMLKVLQSINSKMDALSKAIGETAPEMSLDAEGGKVTLPKSPAGEGTTDQGEAGEKDAVSDEAGASFTEKNQVTRQVVADVLKEYNVKKSVTPRPDVTPSNVKDLEGKKNITGMDVLKAIRSGKRFEDVSRVVKKATHRGAYDKEMMI